ncbi:MAG: baseplate J/gp47 family protein [Rhodospirillales bacterium]|nr:baseplate J/gp47 family protein [Rhodospirillales bacterium]
MSRFAAVDLSSLPKPEVVETLEFEAILAALKADFIGRDPDYSATTLESDPVVKVLEVAAYREVILRQRVNDAARQRMLPYATGANLEVLGADQGVYRLILDPGDPDAVPPVDPTYETDDDLRRRIQLAPEALTTAGCEGSYVFNGLTAGETPVSIDVASPDETTVTLTYTFDAGGLSAKIKDATAIRPEAGSVLVTVLGREGDGTVDAPTCAIVEANLSAASVRPLCDEVTVQSATIVGYTVTALLTVYDGLDRDAVQAAADASMRAIAEKRHALGEDVTQSVIDAALHVAGVKKVMLTDWADVACDDTEAPYMIGLALTTELAA